MGRPVCRAREEGTGALVVERLRLAHTHWTRLKGLLGTRSLPPGEGLWLRPCRQVHTFGMRFPIDVAFCDRYGFVLHTTTLAPRRVSRPVWRAYFAIEAAAGAFARWGLQLGDVVEVKG